MPGRIKVGVDFGTTFTGVAAVHTALPGDVATIKTWPGGQGISSDKVPTVFVYNSSPGSDAGRSQRSRNPERSVSELSYQFSTLFRVSGQTETIVPIRWGRQVLENEDSVRFCKLLLDSSQEFPHFADPEHILCLLQNAGRGVTDAVADFLGVINKHIVAHLVERWGQSVLDDSPIDYIFAVPAMWSDAAKEATRLAAIRAGMGSNLRMISEPEAAAVHTLAALQPNNRIPGHHVLVGDCGGGTVDLITYKFLQVEPTLKVEEAVAGSGGLCGSAFINQRFERFVESRLGTARFADMVLHKRRTWATAKQNFEDFHKRLFCVQGGRLEYNIPFPGLPDDAAVGIEDGFLTLSAHEMKGLFDPVIEDVIKLFDGQVAHLHAQGHNLAAIVLVGGFGQSPYLYERLRAYFTTNHPPTYTGGTQRGDTVIEFMRPPDAWQAVVMGAVRRGLEMPIVESRKYRQHLGFSTISVYDADVHQPWQCYWHPIRHSWYARHTTRWIIPKGTQVSEQVKFSHSFSTATALHASLSSSFSTRLYACHLDEAPKTIDPRHNCRNDPSIRHHSTITADLSAIPISRWVTRSTSDGHLYRELFFDIQITIDSAEMLCELLIDGISYGSVAKSFDD